MSKPIEIRTSPHLKRVMSVDRIMRGVVFALLPIAAFAVWQFGLSALLLLVTTTGVAMATEALFARLSGRGNTLSDWSVVITGLLLGLTLPPGFPLWMAAVAAFVGVALGKALFGGLGYNVMNPALVGRAFVQAAFPVAITSWTPAFAPGRFTEVIPSTLTAPFMQPIPVDDWVAGLSLDGWSGATPLALQKFQQIETPIMDTFTGMIAGSAGETSAILILICGLWLAWRRMLDWRIPVSVMAGAVLVALP
ncbi:MAG: RnfABCDGE type electron transport complex subunit D, partial [Chromatiaceae bacterium]|nr:RnfABCDGE type electron transport complex subunit D [Chromatiaceae bacterium]